ncbi:unnamed protein product [Adineta ricciae]|uniref:Histidine decarboxylase n=1 Tax=Adineta ricciae TaxID=249248 RepID=A0A815SFA2_ADIRI|nr:unnamed protein product [Adineta ricciae]CAF1524830.1 unnamed protein product [Adineta ricciae]
MIVVNDSEANVAEQEQKGEMFHSYPHIIGLDHELFRLNDTPITDECQYNALGRMETYLKVQNARMLGFQTNKGSYYSKKLSFMLDVNANNAGDPFVNGSYTMNTKIMERAVLDYFAHLWHAESPSNPANRESYWGYVLSMGSTEGNLYALYNAREYLKGKILHREQNQQLPCIRSSEKDGHSANTYIPVAFFSEDTHYSVGKALRMLEIRTFFEIGEMEYKGQCPITSDGHWPKKVPCENGNGGPGSVDVDKLIVLVEYFAQKGYPPLIILNVGTTFKGAYDDVEKVGNLLKPVLTRYKLHKRTINYTSGKSDERTGYWIHVDGALGASYLPFIEKARDRIKEHIPKFDFSLPFVHSIVTSAHKISGCPVPSGIYMTKHKYQITSYDNTEYIGSPDTTFAGSRNAIAPAALWCYYASTSDEIESERAVQMQDMAKYAETKLKELDQESQHYGYNLWIARSPLSLSIIFRDPENEDIKRRYSLSEMKLQIDDETEPRKYVHIYTMSSVTKKMIEELVEDLRREYKSKWMPK